MEFLARFGLGLHCLSHGSADRSAAARSRLIPDALAAVSPPDQLCFLWIACHRPFVAAVTLDRGLIHLGLAGQEIARGRYWNHLHHRTDHGAGRRVLSYQAEAGARPPHSREDGSSLFGGTFLTKKPRRMTAGSARAVAGDADPAFCDRGPRG